MPSSEHRSSGHTALAALGVTEVGRAIKDLTALLSTGDSDLLESLAQSYVVCLPLSNCCARCHQVLLPLSQATQQASGQVSLLASPLVVLPLLLLQLVSSYCSLKEGAGSNRRMTKPMLQAAQAAGAGG